MTDTNSIDEKGQYSDTKNGPLLGATNISANHREENPGPLDELEFTRANERQEEIILDRALAKSSNVSSPTPADQINEEATTVRTSLPNEDVKFQLIQPASNGTGNKETLVQTSKSQSNSKNETEVVNLEDDFFSMSYVPLDVQIMKKKKKKTKKKKRSPSQSIPPEGEIISLDSTPPRAETQVLVNNSHSALDDDIVVVEERQAQSGKISEVIPKSKVILKRPITPPSVDEATFKRKFLLEKNQESFYIDTNSVVDTFGDDFMTRLAKVDAITKSVTPTEIGRSATLDSNDSENRSGREYLLQVTSYLPGSSDHAIDIKVKGTKRFSTVIGKVLKYLLSLDIIPPSFHPIYRPELIVLLWKEMKLIESMRIDSLDIPERDPDIPTVVQLELYTHAQAQAISEQKRLKEQERLKQQARDDEFDRILQAEKVNTSITDPFKDDEEFKKLDELEPTSLRNTPIPILKEDEVEDENYFKIGLKGEDNNKVIVQVNTETKISKLISYYLTKKALPSTTKIRLVFDDEEIDLTGTVGDTELEEDFTVDVYII